jgi:hypothetical protein
MDGLICEHIDENGEVSALVAEDRNGKIVFFGNLEHGIKALQESDFDRTRTAEAISSIRSIVRNSTENPLTPETHI